LAVFRKKTRKTAKDALSFLLEERNNAAAG
jgi:hypothetical protein